MGTTKSAVKKPMARKKRGPGVNKGGRPTLMTQDTIDKLVNAFSIGCTDLEACLVAGISKQTLYNYQEKHPKFVDRKEMLKKTLVMASRNNIATQIKAGDLDTSKWYLERKEKAEFSTRAEVSGPEGKPVEVRTFNASKLSTAALEEILKVVDEASEADA